MAVRRDLEKPLGKLAHGHIGVLSGPDDGKNISCSWKLKRDLFSLHFSLEMVSGHMHVVNFDLFFSTTPVCVAVSSRVQIQLG